MLKSYCAAPSMSSVRVQRRSTVCKRRRNCVQGTSAIQAVVIKTPENFSKLSSWFLVRRHAYTHEQAAQDPGYSDKVEFIQHI